MKKKVIFLSVLILAILGAALDTINTRKENNNSYVQIEKKQETQSANSQIETLKNTENELKTLSKEKLAFARNE